jgi:hypothetical protein
MGMIENRRDYRLPFRTKVVFSAGDKVYTGNCTNISAGGLFVTLLESAEVMRDSVCHCVFALNPGEDPLTLKVVVKRVIAQDPNPEVIPGVAFSYAEAEALEQGRLREYMDGSRQNFELASTILSSGEPDLTSLEPLIQRMHLPPTTDLGELAFQIERILRSIELVDANNQRAATRTPTP